MKDSKGNQQHEVRRFGCSCGSDTCICQVCGDNVCGMQAKWMAPVPNKAFDGNVCFSCLKKKGII